MRELDDEVYKKMISLTDEGNKLQDDRKLVEAREKFKLAFSLLPIDYQEWDAATWILLALGDTSFLLKDYSEALMYLECAMWCPEAIGNPFIHLRLGQVQFELGNMARAKDELIRAYMGDGLEIFEEEDEKYLNFVKTHIKLS